MNTVKTLLAAGLTTLVLMTSAAAGDTSASSPVSAAAIEAAATPAEHNAIAQSFEDEAASLTKKADMHRDTARDYGRPGARTTQVVMRKHCLSLEQSYRAAAAENLALATIHREIAGQASK